MKLIDDEVHGSILWTMRGESGYVESAGWPRKAVGSTPGHFKRLRLATPSPPLVPSTPGEK